MRYVVPFLVLACFGCAASSASGRLPATLASTTAQAIPGSTVDLRSHNGTHFTETEIMVEMGNVPGAVRALRNSACPNREGPAAYSALEIEGALAYAVHAGEGRRSCTVTARPSGERIRVVEAIEPSDLPPGVTRAIGSIFQDDFDLFDAFRRTEQATPMFEVHVRKGGRVYILVLSPAGIPKLRLRRYPATLDVPDR